MNFQSSNFGFRFLCLRILNYEFVKLEILIWKVRNSNSEIEIMMFWNLIFGGIWNFQFLNFNVELLNVKILNLSFMSLNIEVRIVKFRNLNLGLVEYSKFQIWIIWFFEFCEFYNFEVCILKLASLVFGSLKFDISNFEIRFSN